MRRASSEILESEHALIFFVRAHCVTATAFEFRYRFGILGVIYFLCFWWTGLASRGHFGGLWIQLTAWLSRLDGLSNDANSAIVRWVIVVLAVSAALLRTWAAAHIRSTVVHANEFQTRSVVTSGPFAYMRNPLYVGVILLTICLAPINNPLPGVVLIMLITLFLVRLARREEVEMQQQRGDSFSRYRENVPSFLPAFRAYRQDGSHPAAWGQAFLGEVWFWGLSAATVTYAFTFRIDWFDRILLVGFGLYLIMRAVLRRES